MKAVILAAGEGTRLQSLTERYPKPMLPVGGRPVLEYLLELLRAHDITDVAINLHYHSEVVTDHFGDGARLGMRIIYSHEEELLGTAGALKRMKSFLDDTFVVLCGDLLTDADLTSLAEFHRWRDAVATMALYRVEEPGRAGLVDVAGNGRILRFEEKPPPGRRFTNLACAGIYVFEPSILTEIPDASASDLGRDLFPRLVDRGLPVFGLEGVGQVLDIGSAERYALAQVIVASLSSNGGGDTGAPAIIDISKWRQGPSKVGVPDGTKSAISDFLLEARRLLEGIALADLEAVVSLLVGAYRCQRAVFAVGNGGSASTASHLASDLTRGTQQAGGPPLRAFSLSDNVPQLTAWSNDACYEESFAGPLRAYARRGDVLVAVSASGDSPNILAAAQEARKMGLSVIALTGFGGGRLKELADVSVIIDSHDYGQVEGAHMVLVHLIAKAILWAVGRDQEVGEAVAGDGGSENVRKAPATVVGAMEAAG